MARLRIRVELNGRTAGVPLRKLTSVVEETQRFLHLLAEDVKIGGARNEWLASDFDNQSLNFTAEYASFVSTEQVRAFGAAFGGSTSLRRETIAQFTQIAEALSEDELIGFGLFQTDQENEPSEWRCLSRRDAVRIASDLQLLAKAAGEHESDSPLPSMLSSTSAGRRLFKDHRERQALAADPAKSLRELEAALSGRIRQLEDQVKSHNQKIDSLGRLTEVTEERFRKVLGAMESFWTQAPRQLASGLVATGLVEASPNTYLARSTGGAPSVDNVPGFASQARSRDSKKNEMAPFWIPAVAVLMAGSVILVGCPDARRQLLGSPEAGRRTQSERHVPLQPRPLPVGTAR